MTSKNEQLVKGEALQAVQLVGPGLKLREAREKASLSLEEVAASLCLRVSVISDLEQDNYETMAGQVFARGYLRAYSKLLQLNSEEIINAYNALGLKDKRVEKTLWQSRARAEKRERPVRGLVFGIITALLVFSVLCWQAQRQSSLSSRGDTRVLSERITKLEPTLAEIEHMQAVGKERSYLKGDKG